MHLGMLVSKLAQLRNNDVQTRDITSHIATMHKASKIEHKASPLLCSLQPCGTAAAAAAPVSALNAEMEDRGA